MKILVVSNMFPDRRHPAYGTFIKEFCKQLSELGHSYELSVMHQSDSKVGKAFKYACFYLKTFFKCMLKNYDVVYIHYASYSSIPVIAARKIKNFLVFTNVHGSDVIPENKRQEKMHENTVEVLKLSERVIVPSQYFKKLVCKKYNKNENNVFIYPSGGVDTELFHPINRLQREKILTSYGIDPKFPTFALVGRISQGKGWDVFVKAAAEVYKRGNVVNFIIVGDGPQSADLKNEMIKYGVTDKIKRIGLIDHKKLAKVYGSLDFIVNCSRRAGESLCLIILEAMACGTPAISSNYAAPQYYVKDGFNGYKFECDDYLDLTDKIEKCISLDMEEINRLREQSVKTAQEYSKQNVLPALSEVFNYKM